VTPAIEVQGGRGFSWFRRPSTEPCSCGSVRDMIRAATAAIIVSTLAVLMPQNTLSPFKPVARALVAGSIGIKRRGVSTSATTTFICASRAGRIDSIEPILGPVDDIKIGMDRLAATAAENGDVEKLCSANDGSKRWQCYEQYLATVVTRDIPSSSCGLVHLVHELGGQR
jgi:hypothetical protein